MLRGRSQLITLFVFVGFVFFYVFVGGRQEVEILEYKGVEEYKLLDEVVNSEGAIIFNLDSGTIIAGKNINTPIPIASITKLISADIINKHIDSDDVVALSDEDLKLFGNTDLKKDQSWNARELLKFSLITSSNRGISALVNLVENKTDREFEELMNELIIEYTLPQTHFFNPTGLDEHTALSGGESSVFDLTKFIKMFLKNNKDLSINTSYVEADFKSSSLENYTAINTNRLLSTIDEDIRVVLSKTGFTDIAGGSLLMVIEISGVRYALIVLNSDRAGRFDNMRKLLAFVKDL